MTVFKKYYLILISLAGGLILSAAWPVRGIPVLLFIGFIPFIFIEDYIQQHSDGFRRASVFWYVYPGLLLWNVLTTWWIWNSTEAGSIAAFLLNTLMMSATFQFYHFTRKNMPVQQGHFMLIFFWITFEYFHHNWDGTWPWLSLGNGFAAWHKWVQWYEYTGMFGGTLWILLVNILFYKGIRNIIEKKIIPGIVVPFTIALLLIILPIILSYCIYNRYTEMSWPVDVVVVQPNVDPWSEEFTIPPQELLQRNLDLAKQKMDSSVDFAVSPESAIQERIWENNLDISKSLATLRVFISGYPQGGYIIGASTYREYFPGETPSATARKFIDADHYYDAYNTAFYIDPEGHLAIHHKSKLTPGVEKMPFARYLKWMDGLAVNLGGTVGSLGVDPERTVFERKRDGLKIAPVICYESVYGEYMAQYIRKGANLIFVITNDGWWGNSPGHRQHFTFSKLRAIETRRSIARSANTGISAFIDQRGDAFQVTDYWVPAVIRQKINANDEITFYVRYGDYIARISSFVALFLMLIAIAYKIMHRKKQLS